MTNIYRKQKGLATLAVSSILLFIVTGISLFTAKAMLTEQKIVTNTYRFEQASQAAQAGLDYGMIYLMENTSSVATNTELTGSLSNGATYSVILAHVGSADLFQLTATGLSDDASASRVIKQQARNINASSVSMSVPVKATGAVTVDGNADIVNLQYDSTINCGGAVSLGGSASTVISSGVGSNSTTIGPDISCNDAGLAALSSAELFDDQFGTSFSSYAPAATLTYSGSGHQNYS
jgi:hypothetical protein